MTLSEDLRDRVRQRAGYACEFCGIRETDAGGELTVDHFRPVSQGGDDTPGNLVYCCPRCNEYKHSYWPQSATDLNLWNPRKEPATCHFVELEDGMIHPLTPTGAFTIRRLRLNRPALVAKRLADRNELEELLWLRRYRDLAQTLGQLVDQQAALIEEQQKLLTEQRELLRLLSR